MLFRIDKKKLFLACANLCMGTSEAVKAAGCSTVTFQRISHEKPVQSVTVGKICKFLGVKPCDIISE